MRASTATRSLTFLSVVWLAVSILACAQSSSAQSPLQLSAPQARITQILDESQRITLQGNVHPLARAAFDRGAAPPDLPMQRMLLVLSRSAQQESALQKLLDDQQDKASPNFHKWLTPDEFGQQFGPADGDVQTITNWLQSHGFQVARVSKGRSIVEFSGNAAQVQEAFHTAIHKFTVNGEDHWANTSDPQIPAALAPVVAGINTLHNFPRRSMLHSGGAVSRSKATGVFTPSQPLFTLPMPGGGCGVQSGFCYGVGPYDFATIYNVLPLWTSSPTAINGTGVTIAIVGNSDINSQDVTDFRNFFGLPTANFQQLHDGPDPGIGESETEADLDVEWSGAIAPAANIDLVVAEDTETTSGVDLAAENIVDNNLASILSESFGACELFLGTTGNQFYNQLWQQASAQGIAVLLSSGDSGSAVCDNHDAPAPSPAQYGLAVSGFASTPFATAVGGTDFFDLSNASVYWNTSNATTTLASANSYIPETTWNDTCTNPVFGSLLNYSPNAETNCNDSQLIDNFVLTVGSSGGKSNCTTPSGETPATCSGGYPKPSWQTALTPADGKRDVPDVSLFSAAGSPSGSFYVICEADALRGASSCDPNNSNTEFLSIGGTSASAPAMAGILALVEQKVGSRLGNANYVLYKLATQQTGNCNSSTGSGSNCVFNDVTTGTIAMPCQKGSANCTTTVTADQYGILSGYTAGTGFDLATGLGSVNAANLVAKWAAVTLTPSVTVLNSLTPTTITHGQAVNVSIGVAPQSGSGTPTGTVSLISDLTSKNAGIGNFTLSAGTATGTTSALPGGTYHVSAHYAGDGTFASSDSAPISVTVNKENSTTQVGLVALRLVNNQVVTQDTTTAVYGSPYFIRAGVIGSTCSSNSREQLGCPTGSVAFAGNGNTIGTGSFPLNSSGFAEDQFIQLLGGAYTVEAQYSGDNSFNPSSGAATITITPALDTIAAPTIGYQSSAGVSIGMGTTVQASLVGVAPTGNVMFYANGNPLAGSLSVAASVNGTNTSPYPTLGVDFTNVLIPNPGTYTITATYSGDKNYQPANSPPTTIQLKFPTPSFDLNPPSGASLASGQEATVTATFVGVSKTIAPTGTVSFTSGVTQGAVAGSVSYVTTTDANGNAALQAVLIFSPTYSDQLTIIYSGDANYPTSGGWGWMFGVPGTGFSLLAIPSSSLTVSSGGQGTQGIAVAGQADYHGTMTFDSTSCSGLPPQSRCQFDYASVIGSGGTDVTIITTAPQGQSRHTVLSRRFGGCMDALGLLVVGILMLDAPRRRRSRTLLLSLFSASLVMLALAASSCGGGSLGSGGGGGVSGTPSGTYNITITPTTGGGGQSVTFRLIVQ